MRTPTFRPVVWLLVAVLSGCGGGGGDDGGPTVLFEDDFSSGNLTDHWVVTTGSDSGQVISDANFGNAAPSVWFQKDANTQSGASQTKLTSDTNFTASGGLTITFQVAGRAAGELWVTIPAGANACRSGAQFRPTEVAYQAGNDNSASRAINQDSNFHTFVFRIAKDGAIYWYRDGQLQNSKAANQDCISSQTIYTIETKMVGTSAQEISINLDNVYVTRP